MAAQRAKAGDALATNKVALLTALAAAGVSTVIVTFDGYGDSGQIESMDTRSGDDDIALPATAIAFATIGWTETAPVMREMTLADAVEQIVYDCLWQTHGGWENNEGAFGTFIFDIAEGTIALEHNERVSDVETFTHVF